MCPPAGLSWDGPRPWVPLQFQFPKNHISCLPFWYASICSLPLVGWVFLPWPKVAPCLLWLGRCLGGMVKGWAKFISLPSKFFCSFHISLSLSTNHLAASSSLLPDHGMPPLDLLPPAAAHLLMRPLGIWVFLPNPSKICSITGTNWCTAKRPTIWSDIIFFLLI